jgi:hypothetical protein
MATTSERRRHAIKNGYRSGLEDDIAKDLKDRGVEFEYEKLKVQWQLLENKTYTPDFKLPNGIIIESKGRFVQADRKKHLIIQDQHPFLDIRFVFSNSRLSYTKVQRVHMGIGAISMGSCTQIKGYPTSG